jgi:dTDP-4-amino-4,6-dideoxy-D-galactose acyltransferase
MNVKKLEWDSDFFKKRIGEILINNKTNQSISGDNFDLIYVKSVDNNIVEIENFKQTFVETKVVFAKKITGQEPIDVNVISFFNTNVNKEIVYQLAFESGKFSRFNLDQNFSQIEFQDLYKKWIDNSINKRFSDDILVYKEGQNTIGFVSYKVHDNHAIIGLIAINPNEQGKGIGKKLIIAVENQLKSMGISELHIPTQLANEAACGFYTKLGYKMIEKLIIKHYWRI